MVWRQRRGEDIFYPALFFCFSVPIPDRKKSRPEVWPGLWFSCCQAAES
jgi:hypothetical protein